MLPPEKTNLYRALESLPSHLRGEIFNDELVTRVRSTGKHILTASNIGAEYYGPYQKGQGGPGDWWILKEPEVHLKLNEVVVVPDLVGWRKSRMPHIPDTRKFTVVPDWVCEIHSPSTTCVDREIKKPLYAHYGVTFLWIVDPAAVTLETFELHGADWQSTGMFTGDSIVCAGPFEEKSVNLTSLIGE